MNADLRRTERVKPGQVVLIPDASEAAVYDSDSNVIVIHNDAPAHRAAAPVHATVAVHPMGAVKPAPVRVIAEASQPTAPHDTQVIIENDAATMPSVTDNVAIIDSQVIHVPSAPPPELAAAMHRGQLASRRGSMVMSIIALARHFMGVPYVWGGTTPGGFDCSGFTMRIFALNGVHLQRTADCQYYQGTPVKDPSPGDLVFFSTYLPGPSHVGIYLGGNQFIHASSRHGVTVSSLSEPFFAKKYIGARRYF
jgi:cell wall-associated NlpC family hydrolase